MLTTDGEAIVIATPAPRLLRTDHFKKASPAGYLFTLLRSVIDVKRNLDILELHQGFVREAM